MTDDIYVELTRAATPKDGAGSQTDHVDASPRRTRSLQKPSDGSISRAPCKA